MSVVIDEREPFNGAESVVSVGFNIRKDSIVLTDTFSTALSFDNRKSSNGIIQIHNTGEESIEYEVYGHVNDTNNQPPDFSTSEWISLVVEQPTIPAAGTGYETLTDRHSWILIRMKSQTVAGSSAKVFAKIFLK